MSNFRINQTDSLYLRVVKVNILKTELKKIKLILVLVLALSLDLALSSVQPPVRFEVEVEPNDEEPNDEVTLIM